MKCEKCKQRTDLVDALLTIEWKELILGAANISTTGAQDIASMIRNKIERIDNEG